MYETRQIYYKGYLKTDQHIDIQQIPFHEFYIHNDYTFRCLQEKGQAPSHVEIGAENYRVW